MIDTTLKFLAGEINRFATDRFTSEKEIAVVSGLVGQDGNIAEEALDHVVLTVVNIEREYAGSGPSVPTRQQGGVYARVAPPMNINLYLLISTPFNGRYDEALALLSAVLGLFQSKPVFTREESQQFPAGLTKLSLEPVNMDWNAQNGLWGILGAKYVPSVLYKARMLTLQQNWLQDLTPAVTGVDTDL